MAVEEATNAVKNGISSTYGALSGTVKTLAIPTIIMTGVGLAVMPAGAIAGVTEPVVQGTLTTAETVSELLGGVGAAAGSPGVDQTVEKVIEESTSELVAGGAPIFTPGG